MIDSLNKLVTRAVGLVWLVPSVLIPVIAVLSWNQYQMQQTIENLTKNIPIMVVPGAVAGVYTAGINEENLKNASRYVAGLMTNFTRKNAAQRLSEMETMVDNTYLVNFQAIKAALLKEIEEKSEGRAFVEQEQNTVLKRADDGTYTFVMRGDRTFFSGSLVLNQDVGEAELKFKLSSPSQKNKYGVSILGVDVRPLKNAGQ